jgi:hypothetical protein
MEQSGKRHEWRCGRCRTLLGIERAGRIHLKHKDAQYFVEGNVMAICHRCCEPNRTRTTGQSWSRLAA